MEHALVSVIKKLNKKVFYTGMLNIGSNEYYSSHTFEKSYIDAKDICKVVRPFTFYYR